MKHQAEPNAHLQGMQAKRADPTSRECKSHDERGALGEGRLDDKLKVYTVPRLLIVDGKTIATLS